MQCSRHSCGLPEVSLSLIFSRPLSLIPVFTQVSDEMGSDQDRLVIFDTTLRDGEQSPGVALSVEQKVTIAEKLSALGVNVCEIGERYNTAK